jgi:hypothetical protein
MRVTPPLGRALALAATLLLSSLASVAAAQDRHDTTEALLVGGRFDPGAAWLVGYDLEIELGTSCGFNLGPSATVAFGGLDGGPQRQDLLATLDVLRGRFLLDQHSCGACGYRLQALLGAGMYFAMHGAAEIPRVYENDNGETLSVIERFAAEWRFGAQLTGGMSADWWLGHDWAITGLVAFHVRLDDHARMPGIWAEAGLGIRFGT